VDELRALLKTLQEQPRREEDPGKPPPAAKRRSRPEG